MNSMDENAIDERGRSCTPCSYGVRRMAAGLLLAAAPLWGPAAIAQDAANVDQARLMNAEQDPNNWITHGGTPDEQHYSPLDQINIANISRLGLAWYGEFDTSRGQEATPLVVDGVLYTSTAWSKVYAYDAATGKQLWFFDPQVPGSTGPEGCCDVVNRGVAAWGGMIFLGAWDGRLIAIDAKTGEKRWETQTTPPNRNYTITGAPRVVKGKVLIGNGGAEYGVRGFVSAYDAQTGELAWRFYITPNPQGYPDGAASDDVHARIGYATWGDGAWRQTGGGGTPWDAIVYDREFDQVLVGTGNGHPWNHTTRSGGEGDNLFLSAIVALDAETGQYKWHYQSTPGEEWDYTATQPIMLTDLTINGQVRKVAMQAPKNGFFYVIDRSDGKLISARNFMPVNWAAGIDLQTGRPIEYPAARYSLTGQEFMGIPGASGAHNWQPMSYHPKTGLVYLPAQQAPYAYRRDPNWRFDPTPGVWNLANASARWAAFGSPTSESERIFIEQSYRSDLIAWDPIRQQEVWRVVQPSYGAGGTLATAGNLVFQGTPDGFLHAYAADTGQEVWRYDGRHGIIAGAMSYAVDGVQYIAVLSGLGGSWRNNPYVKNARSGMGRVLVFKLDGDAVLPPYASKRGVAQVSDEVFAQELIAQGRGFYGANCAVCHGSGGYSNGEVITDLRRSPMLVNKEAFSQVAYDGILEHNGMVSFSFRLTQDNVEAIRAFLLDRAGQLKADEDALEAAAGNPTYK